MQGLLPGGEPLLPLVLVDLVEHVTVEPQPSAVRVVLIHHVLPEPHWQAIIRFLAPGDLIHLKRAALCVAVEDRPAEEKRQGHLAAFESVEVLRRSHVEVVAALYGQVHHAIGLESRYLHARVGPEQAAERLAPPVHLAEQLDEALMVCRGIAPSRRLDADLTEKRHVLHCNVGSAAEGSSSAPSAVNSRSTMAPHS